MTNVQKLLTILFSLICLFACVVTLVFYFAFKPKNNNDEIPIIMEDIVVEVGKKYEIIYSLTEKNAVVKFSVTDGAKATVRENKYVQGVQEGVTFLKAEVMLDNKKFTEVAQITVISSRNEDEGENEDAPTYTQLYHTIVAVQNCTIERQTLFLQSNSAVFELNLFSDENKTTPLAYSNVTFTSSEGVQIQKEFSYFIVTATNNGYFYINIEDYDYLIYIQIYI